MDAPYLRCPQWKCSFGFVHHLWNSDPLAVGYNPACRPRTFHYWSLFTLPILIGVSAALFLKNHRLNFIGLCLSLTYLVWALGISVFINGKMEEKLNEQGVPYSQFISSPAPFTTLLWRTVEIHNDQYFETYYSLFDGDAPLSVNFYPRNLSLMKGMDEHPPVAKLENFTRGYFAMSENNGSIAMTDLRMGSEPNYVFQFRVAELEDQKIFLLNRLDFRLFVTGVNCHGSGRGSGILKHELI